MYGGYPYSTHVLNIDPKLFRNEKGRPTPSLPHQLFQAWHSINQAMLPTPPPPPLENNPKYATGHVHNQMLSKPKSVFLDSFLHV